LGRIRRRERLEGKKCGCREWLRRRRSGVRERLVRRRGEREGGRAAESGPLLRRCIAMNWTFLGRRIGSLGIDRMRCHPPSKRAMHCLRVWPCFERARSKTIACRKPWRRIRKGRSGSKGESGMRG
jgi:hypothetical protein